MSSFSSQDFVVFKIYCSRGSFDLMESLLPVKNSRSAIVIEPWGVMLFRFSFVSGYSGRSYVVQLPSLESDHQEAERDSFSMLTTLHLITRR